MGWVIDETFFAVCWLLGFVAVNIALGVWSRARGRADRATIRRIRREGIGPVEAARQVSDERQTARTAVYLLYLRGTVEVSEEGVLTAVPDAPEPADPVLSALLHDIRRRGASGARLYEFLDDDDFALYRNRLESHVPDVRRYAERTRAIALSAAFVLSVGINLHGVVSQTPFPPLGNDPGWWILLWFPIWAVLSLCAAAWPSEFSRRWRSFNRYCEQRVADALGEGPPYPFRAAVDKGAYRPTPPSPPRQGGSPSAERGAPGDGGSSWADDAGAYSCGGD
ncbi:hypothetical protein ACWD4V_28605 [Streptomyces tsukubensis]